MHDDFDYDDYENFCPILNDICYGMDDTECDECVHQIEFKKSLEERT